MNSSFEGNTSTGTDEWLTPPEIIKSLGVFDLDPCSPINRPWDTAIQHYTIVDDGLMSPWFGRVWLNPPYGKYTEFFMEKAVMHTNCIALIFARTDTRWFQRLVLGKADAILFMAGRISFYRVNGTRGGGGWRTFSVDCLRQRKR
jgi:hypothetical protein